MFAIERKSRAFTLLEVIVGFSLFLLIGLLLFQVFVPTLQAIAATQRRVGLQQRCIVAMHRLENDLQNSVPAGLSVASTADTIVGQPLQEFTPEGAQVFQQMLWVYTLNGQELRRGEWTSPGPPALSLTLETNKAQRVAVPDFVLLSTNLARYRTLADEVTQFQVLHGGVGSSVAGPLTIQISLGNKVNDGARVQMRKVISPRLGEG